MHRIFPGVRIGLFLCCPVLAWGSVGIRDIEFTRLTADSRAGEWLECAIEVEVRRDTRDPSRKDPSWVDDLGVTLMLGIETPSDSGSSFEFFRSEASLVALEEGRHFIRFYLPPEIVERDRIRNDVHSFLVQLTRSGALVFESVSQQLERPQVKQSFLRRIEAEAPSNDGILLPQFKTPFFTAYARETPTYRDLATPVLIPPAGVE